MSIISKWTLSLDTSARQSSKTGRLPMICSWLNFGRFMVRSFLWAEL
ncbi:hypothetical protein Rumeso_01747 [Rubellimicrobium mesophilum DSM 19309]|uniref:Uncharacterized protein n=1 Tax=Rubellimicrobium mesophilum DSM 19309 TaxID=442562 RepID=A0A017HSQ5_9RHOB|nr:hypothetical protein Rumeso_01747 [Rubellimicrobium mesophilum DSM 19309]